MRTLFISSALALLATAAMADWSNPELDARNLSKNQWNAIAQGDFAKCRVDATITTRQVIPPFRLCNEGDSAYIVQACMEANRKNRADAEKMHNDLIYGCMARLGWTYTTD
jgi:hypothetical protein